MDETGSKHVHHIELNKNVNAIGGDGTKEMYGYPYTDYSAVYFESGNYASEHTHQITVDNAGKDTHNVEAISTTPPWVSVYFIMYNG